MTNQNQPREHPLEEVGQRAVARHRGRGGLDRRLGPGRGVILAHTTGSNTPPHSGDLPIYADCAG